MTAHTSLQDKAKKEYTSSTSGIFSLLLVSLFCFPTHPNRPAWEAEDAASGNRGQRHPIQ